MATTAEQIAARLAELLPVYEEIQARLKEWAKLQKAEAARNAHERQTAEFDDELAQLSKQKEQLEVERRKLKLQEKAGPIKYRPPLVPVPPPVPPPPPEASPRPRAIDQKAIQEARRQLKKLVGRWGRVWQLSGDVQGRINRIADDPARPLGEALALLGWDTFGRPYSSVENEPAHLARLDGWGAALLEYRAWLADEIEMLRTKYRRLLPLLDAWEECTSEEGRRRWEQRIAETLEAKRREVKTLGEEIGKLKAEIALLKA